MKSDMEKYIKPSLQVSDTELGQMLAESLVINNDTTVDGGDALAKEFEDWNIWGEE